MIVKPTLLWKASKDQQQALLNAEKVKTVWESFFEVLEMKVCILMAKFQDTTEFVMCFEGSSSTTWI